MGYQYLSSQVVFQESKKTEISNNFINPFEPKVPFLIPLKTPESRGFMTFSGGLKRQVWFELDERDLKEQQRH